jgi:Fe-S cluster assembly scaffold protein SufB
LKLLSDLKPDQLLSDPGDYLLPILINSNSKNQMAYQINLLKPDIRLQVLVLAFLQSPNTSIILTTKVIHSAKNTSSDVEFKTVLYKQTSIDYTGTIKIIRGATDSSANLSADALILDNNARARMLPSLLIDEQQVQASHSVGISQLDHEQLFYLQSRGINERKARQMLISSFTQSLLVKFPASYQDIFNSYLNPKKRIE